MADNFALEQFPILSMLYATEPHPDDAPALDLFGQFVGTWDMRVSFFDEHEKQIFNGNGEWTFAWILDGRMIQDVLTYAPLDDPDANVPGKRRIGTSLRHYHPDTQQWDVVWFGATSHTVISFKGGQVDSDIHLAGIEADDALLKWQFTDITERSFQWQGFISTDQGSSWRMEQEMYGQRRV